MTVRARVVFEAGGKRQAAVDGAGPVLAALSQELAATFGRPAFAASSAGTAEGFALSLGDAPLSPVQAVAAGGVLAGRIPDIQAVKDAGYSLRSLAVYPSHDGGEVVAIFAANP